MVDAVSALQLAIVLWLKGGYTLQTLQHLNFSAYYFQQNQGSEFVVPLSDVVLCFCMANEPHPFTPAEKRFRRKDSIRRASLSHLILN